MSGRLFPWSPTGPFIKDLFNRRSRAALADLPDDPPDGEARDQLAARVWNAHCIELVVLGDTTVDTETTSQMVTDPDPRYRAIGGGPRKVRATVRVARIPVRSGDPELLAYWPTGRHPALSVAARWNSATDCIVFPFFEELRDPDGSKTSRVVAEADALIRRLADAANRDAAVWNDSLRALIDSGLVERAARAERRSAVHANLPFPVTPKLRGRSDSA